jgi:hypothetical protein
MSCLQNRSNERARIIADILFFYIERRRRRKLIIKSK